MREIFGGFDIEPVKTAYTIDPGDRGRRVGELIISGGRPPDPGVAEQMEMV